MFSMFSKKEDVLDEDTILSAGVTAAVAFRLSEKKFGFTPVSETPKLIDSCKKQACEMLSINPDERSRSVLHMMTLTLAMDDSGLAEEITNRYERGDKRIYSDEAKKIWALTTKNAQEIAGKLRNNGKR